LSPYFTQNNQQAHRSLIKILRHPTASNHNIRATGATAALAEGMDEMTVKRLGGWKSLQTIQYYAREARVRKDIEEKYGTIFN
jgi:integrase